MRSPTEMWPVRELMASLKVQPRRVKTQPLKRQGHSCSPKSQLCASGVQKYSDSLAYRLPSESNRSAPGEGATGPDRARYVRLRLRLSRKGMADQREFSRMERSHRDRRRCSLLRHCGRNALRVFTSVTYVEGIARRKRIAPRWRFACSRFLRHPSCRARRE
jgi:hypothetical protein